MSRNTFTLALTSFTLSALLFDGACASTQNTAAPVTAAAAMNCPISGEPVTKNTLYVAYYGIYPVYCASLSDSTQFGSLPASKRAEVAATQVLAQKKITNTTCPLTGSALTAAASPVKYNETIIGFATSADANQFRSLPKAEQQKIIDAWKASSK